MSEGTTVCGVAIDTALGLAVADVELRDAARVALLAFALDKVTASYARIFGVVTNIGEVRDLGREVRDVVQEIRNRRQAIAAGGAS